jgi:hypothetical protein
LKRKKNYRGFINRNVSESLDLIENTVQRISAERGVKSITMTFKRFTLKIEKILRGYPRRQKILNGL